jgi:small conductance mechanosensitive channel
MQEYFESVDVGKYWELIVSGATSVLLAIIILIVGLYIAKKVYNLINATGQRYENLDDTLFRFLGSLAKYTILAFVGIAILNQFGVQTASIIALMGAAGLAIGLALQGALSNLAAGVMLLVFRPYKVGDFIDAAGQFGNVTEVDLFTTVLQTW